MYCTRCGCQTGELDRYCAQCGNLAPGQTAAAPASHASSFVAVPMPVVQQGLVPMLTRSLRNRKIAGVCAGIAHHFGVDPTLVRILFVVMFFCPVLPAIIPYIVCWIVMPLERPEPLYNNARPEPLYNNVSAPYAPSPMPAQTFTPTAR